MNQDTKAFTRKVLEEAAPEELLLLDSFDPTADRTGSTSSGPLGFGASTVIGLILPAVFFFAEALYKEAAKQTASALIKKIKDSLVSEDRNMEDIKSEILNLLKSNGFDADQSEKASTAISKFLSSSEGKAFIGK